VPAAEARGLPPNPVPLVMRVRVGQLRRAAGAETLLEAWLNATSERKRLGRPHSGQRRGGAREMGLSPIGRPRNLGEKIA
jgi:hypothetical protein